MTHDFSYVQIKFKGNNCFANYGYDRALIKFIKPNYVCGVFNYACECFNNTLWVKTHL